MRKARPKMAPAPEPFVAPSLRARFTALAEVLIPAAGHMPSARDAEVGESCLDRVLVARPDLIRPLADLLQECRDGEPLQVIEALARDCPAKLEMLLVAAAGAYYLCQRVRDSIGYPGQEALSLDRGGFGGEDLLDPMLERAPFFRDPRSPGSRSGLTER